VNTYRFEIQQSVVFCLSVDGMTEAEARARLRKVLERCADGLGVEVPSSDELDDGGAAGGAIYIEDERTAAETAVVLDTEEDEEPNP